MLNHVAMMGRMVADPDLRHTTEGVPVASFRLACEEDRGEYDVSYIDCVAWRRLGEFVRKNFAKGQMAAIEGRLKQTRWSDRDTGAIRSRIEVICENIYFAGRLRPEEYE